MKAQQISQEVYHTELRIQREISKIVASHLNALSNMTGLSIGGLSVELIEATGLHSGSKEWAVARVNIDTSLPPPLWTGIE